MNLFQVAYDEDTYRYISQGGFQILDNRANLRPDWYEYWPIRNYLLGAELDDNKWYGFFSPKFQMKANLNYLEVVEQINKANLIPNVDAVLFSPQPDMGANFLNVFEQAELFDPGFIAAAQKFVVHMGEEIPLSAIVMDSRQIVFSNYFVAKPSFWRTWMQWTETLFACAEDINHPLHAMLCHPTSYAANAQRKVFLLERIASLLFVIRPEIKTHAVNPFNMGWSMTRFREEPDYTYINDSLKRAYRDTGFVQYLNTFIAMRERFVKRANL